MMRRLLSGAIAALLTLTVCAAGASTAFAQDPFKNDTYDPCKKAKDSALCEGKTTNGNNPLTGKNGIIRRVTLVVAMIAAIAAVIIMMVASFMYVSAGGDANKVGEAKRAILYSIIGLVIIAVAESLILFVLSQI